MLVGEGRREPGMPAPTMTTSAAAGTGCRSTTGSGAHIHQQTSFFTSDLRSYRAASTRISTAYSGEASLASTQARVGGRPAATQASQTAFISA